MVLRPQLYSSGIVHVVHFRRELRHATFRLGRMLTKRHGILCGRGLIDRGG
jgi:hypothetical protein